MNFLLPSLDIWVEFEILPSTSLFIINDNIDENCEVIFATKTNEDLVENSVKCKNKK